MIGRGMAWLATMALSAPLLSACAETTPDYFEHAHTTETGCSLQAIDKSIVQMTRRAMVTEPRAVMDHKGIRGCAVVSVVVDHTGMVEDAHIVSHTPNTSPGVWLSAASSAEFEPAGAGWTGLMLLEVRSKAALAEGLLPIN